MRPPHVPVAQPEEQLRPWLQTASSLKLRQRRNPSRSTLLGFLLVLIMGLLTGSWMAPRIDVQLSVLTTLPEELGFARSADVSHPAVGYIPDQGGQRRE